MKKTKLPRCLQRHSILLMFLTLLSGTTLVQGHESSIETLTPSETGIPYGLAVTLDDHGSVQTPPDHVGAWSWDEDGFPATAKGWTHTSKWVKLNLTEPALFTLTLENRANVPWPSQAEPDRLAGTNLFPSFSLYKGWDLDIGVTTNADGTTLDQDHTFNNRGNIAWAEDVTYLDHVDNATSHSITRTWLLPAGAYTLNLGGNSPATIAEGRQGYLATLTTQPQPSAVLNIERSGDSLLLMWSAYLDHLYIEEASEPTGPWTQVNATALELNGFLTIQVTGNAERQFFRLRGQE